MNTLIFLGLFVLIYGTFFAIMLSPWGQKHMG